MVKKYTDINEIIYILEHIREEDMQELKAVYGESWQQKTISELKNKEFLILYGINDLNQTVPIAMGGISGIFPDFPHIGCVWLLTSRFADLNKLKLMKTLSEQIYQAEFKYSILYNYIYKSNKEARKWLLKLGFKFDNPHPAKMQLKDGFEFFYKLGKRKGKECALKIQHK
ncbi:MAG: hypothetical protein LUG16_01105 [Candidatus Gastranaerophilales bacterium]|nr:hypothetical protein [Candidatus Gastranaerophilales bacterium]